MLSSVLRSAKAVAVNIAVMRAFVHLREMIASHTDLSRRIDELERRYDGKFAAVFDAIKQLITTHQSLDRPRRQIGFRSHAP